MQMYYDWVVEWEFKTPEKQCNMWVEIRLGIGLSITLAKTKLI